VDRRPALPHPEIAQIEEARRLWLEVAHARGRDIPLPSNDARFSGRVLLRLPRSLHRRLSPRAQAEGTSLNQYVVYLLSQSVGATAADG
jgi:antitoxin HicB